MLSTKMRDIVQAIITRGHASTSSLLSRCKQSLNAPHCARKGMQVENSVRKDFEQRKGDMGDPYLLKFSFEAYEMYLAKGCSKIRREVQVYAVHSIEFGHPAEKISLLSVALCCSRMGQLWSLHNALYFHNRSILDLGGQLNIWQQRSIWRCSWEGVEGHALWCIRCLL